MEHIIVDSSSSGVCLRCYHTGETIRLERLPISSQLLNRIRTWVQKYEEINYSDSIDYIITDILDQEGINIVVDIKKEISSSRIGYQSDLLLIDIKEAENTTPWSK